MTGDTQDDRSARQGWSDSRAPSLEDFELLADAAFATLPPEFRALCDGVIFKIEDFPDEETMRTMACETEFDLLGLFHGRGLPDRDGSGATGELPNMIWLYRRPILDYWAEHDETLGDIVAHVLIHEIGHHFGFSDDDMEAIEAAAG